MTENEAKRPKVAIVGGGRNAGRILKAHIDLLQELEAYRAIGTVEELIEAKWQYDNINSVAEGVALSGLCDFGTAKESIISEIKSAYKQSLKEYQSIGTVEEFKALKEKNEPKKLKHDVCPNCSTNNDIIIKHLGNPQAHKIVSCWNCGQALDWG